MRVLLSVALGISLAPTLVGQVGTATLTGKAQAYGTGIQGTEAALTPEDRTGNQFVAISDNSGTYRFSGLPAGAYTLKLRTNGYYGVTVKSILIAEAERKQVPPLELKLGGVADCGIGTGIDYLRLLAAEGHLGNFGATVRLYQRQYSQNTVLIAGAEVSLICPGGDACVKTTTDKDGYFVFKDLVPGNLLVRVNLAGYYPIEWRYRVEEDKEVIYTPIDLERCLNGNCDPKLRPARPLILCE
jgi:hypothetical protein